MFCLRIWTYQQEAFHVVFLLNKNLSQPRLKQQDINQYGCYIHFLTKTIFVGETVNNWSGLENQFGIARFPTSLECIPVTL